jgi:histidinol-phosphate/aromatic aminotransferase/cobyric acid decarboxylase-like protein
MNKLGGFDSFNFNKNTINAMEIERKQFKAPLPIGYSKQDRLKTNYNTTINDRISINSDWITEQESILLEELATSPVIYLERSATNFIAVNVTNTNYEIKKYLDNRSLFNLSFDLEYTYSRYRQSL